MSKGFLGKYLDKIREKPEEERHRIRVIFVSLALVPVFIVLVFAMFRSSAPRNNDSTGNMKVTIEKVNEEIKNKKEALQKMFSDLNDLKNKAVDRFNGVMTDEEFKNVLEEKAGPVQNDMQP